MSAGRGHGKVPSGAGGSSSSGSSGGGRSRTPRRAASAPGGQQVPVEQEIPPPEPVEAAGTGSGRGEGEVRSAEGSSPSRSTSSGDEGREGFNEFEKMSTQEVLNLQLKPRPGYGKEGRQIALVTNYLPLHIQKPVEGSGMKPVEGSGLKPVEGSATGGFEGYLYAVKPRRGRKPTGDQQAAQRQGQPRTGDGPKLSRQVAKEIFWGLVWKNQDYFGSPFAILFDGQTIMFTLKHVQGPKTKDGIETEFEDAVEIKGEGRETLCSMTVSLVAPKKVDPEASVRVGPFIEADRSPLQVLDWLIQQGKTCPLPIVDWQGQFEAAGKSIFRIPPPHQRLRSLGCGTEAWVGYFSAAKVGWLGNPPDAAQDPSSWKTLINMDVSNSAFYERKLLFVRLCCEFINDRYGRDKYNYRSLGPDDRFLTGDEYAAFEREFKNKLRLEYTSKNQQGERITVSGIFRGFGDVPAVATFPMRVRNGNGANGQDVVQITVREYFRSVKDMPVGYPNNLRTVKMGRKSRPTYDSQGQRTEGDYPMVPLEYIYVQYPQRVVGKLTEKQTAEMIKSAAKPAPDRLETIRGLIRDGYFHKDQWLKTYQCTLDVNMVETTGRVLQPPVIAFGAGQTVIPKEGTWSIKGQKFFNTVQVHSYGILYYSETRFGHGVPSTWNESDRDFRTLISFCQVLGAEMVNLGCSFPQMPQTVEACGRLDELKVAIRRIKTNARNMDVLFVVLPKKGHAAYVMKFKPMTAQNLCLKLCMKLGGTVNLIRPPANARYLHILNGNTLIFGVDVYHPGAEIGMIGRTSGIPSVASIVAHEDADYTRWMPTIRVQKQHREHIVYMAAAVTERLISFYRTTNIRPDRIIVYRDGVSEGQFRTVLKEEMVGVRRACFQLRADYTPAITYIVTQKRHHTRLFCKNRGDESGRARNIPPGTTVDKNICHPVEFDFYQCAHAGIQGTSRPIHYYVLHDDSNLDADTLQGLTNALSYLFGRCTRSVSIPAPVYFADLSCTRARHHLSEEMNPSTSSMASDSGSGSKKKSAGKPESTRVSESTKASAGAPTSTTTVSGSGESDQQTTSQEGTAKWAPAGGKGGESESSESDEGSSIEADNILTSKCKVLDPLLRGMYYA